MRAFQLVAAFLAVNAVSAVPAANATEPISMKAAYGELAPVEKMAPLWPKARALTSKFMEMRTPDHCIFPFEMVIVQDTTESFKDNQQNMIRDQLPAIRKALERTHPYTEVALISFRDKPVAPYGDASDQCVQFDKPHMSYETLTTFYEKNPPNGGGDMKDNSLGALFAAAASDKINWNHIGDSTKLIVHITDSTAHFADEIPEISPFVPFSGVFDDADPEGQCLREFYPSPQQVVGALKARGAYLAHVVYDPDYFYGKVGAEWQWFNRLHGQPDSFVNLMESDSSDFWIKLMGIITKLEDIECPAIPPVYPVTTGFPDTGPTTAPLPTTATPTTATPTTTEATVTPVGPIETPPTTMMPLPTTAATSEPCECVCPPENADCDTETYCKDGIYINLGFKPAVFEVISHTK